MLIGGEDFLFDFAAVEYPSNFCGIRVRFRELTFVDDGCLVLHTEAVVAAVAGMGVAGEMARARMQPVDGNASFRTYLIDALFNINGEALEAIARVEEL